MIETPTVFILGAGASAPYGYPTGAELRAKIVNEFYEMGTVSRWEQCQDGNSE